MVRATRLWWPRAPTTGISLRIRKIGLPKRDWRRYNEELVVGGEFLFDVRIFRRWKKELRKANKNKRGRPYLYPEPFLKWQAVWHQWVDYRGLEGIVRALKLLRLIPKTDD